MADNDMTAEVVSLRALHAAVVDWRTKMAAFEARLPSDVPGETVEQYVAAVLADEAAEVEARDRLDAALRECVSS